MIIMKKKIKTTKKPLSRKTNFQANQAPIYIFCFRVGNYTSDQQQQPSYGGPRSYGNDLNQYPPGSGDDYKRYLNQNIKQII
jgi:hypothetical protein